MIQSAFTILASMTIVFALEVSAAQSSVVGRKPADIDIESMELLEDNVETATPVQPAKTNTPIIKKKLKKKIAPPRKAQGAVFETGKVYLRMLRDERKYGQLYYGGTFPTFWDFSVFMAGTFKSAASSSSEADMQGYSLGLYLYSPHVYGFGLVAHNSDGPGSADRGVRGGLYYKLFVPSPNISLAFVPSYFPFAEHKNLGRFIAHYIIDFRKTFGLTGTFTYVRLKTKDTMTTTPLAYLQVVEGLRLLGGYNWTSEDIRMRVGWQWGIQITNTF